MYRFKYDYDQLIHIIEIDFINVYKMNKKRYKNLKYICDKCGAYNHRNQGTCGICMSTHIRKATKREIEETINFFETMNIHFL